MFYKLIVHTKKWKGAALRKNNIKLCAFFRSNNCFKNIYKKPKICVYHKFLKQNN